MGYNVWSRNEKYTCTGHSQRNECVFKSEILNANINSRIFVSFGILNKGYVVIEIIDNANIRSV